jgi:hypothetical protein
MLTFLRANAVGVAAALVLLALGVLGARLVSGARTSTAPRKAVEFRIVTLQQQQPKPTPPPPEVKQIPPKIEDQPQPSRVTLKPTDFTPPDMSRPAPSPAGGGRLSLAEEGQGPGDAFNLVGNPGGRGILTGGGLGDGTGDGAGDGLGGGDGLAARFGWYYAKIASEVEEAFRKHKVLSTSATRVELRIWADPAGVVRRIELLKSTGDSAVDEAIQSIVGLKLREAPPAEIPMPMIARLTSRRAR